MTPGIATKAQLAWNKNVFFMQVSQDERCPLIKSGYNSLLTLVDFCPPILD